MEIGWSESVELRFKVHLLDEGYAWVPTTCNFVKDFVFREEKLVREALPLLEDLWRSTAQFPSGQDLNSKYSSRATRGHRNQEFSSKIRAEVHEGRGLRSSGLQKVSSSLKEVGNLPTRVYFLYKYCFDLIWALRAIWIVFANTKIVFC